MFVVGVYRKSFRAYEYLFIWSGTFMSISLKFRSLAVSVNVLLAQAALLASLLAYLPAAQAVFDPTSDIASERVQRFMHGGQNLQYGWEADFSIGYSADTRTFNIDLGLGFIGSDGTFEPEDSLLAEWEAGIEDNWSNRYFLIDSDSELYNLQVDAQLFTPTDFQAIPLDEQPLIHHVVTVYNGSGAVNLNDWYTNPVNPFSQGQLAAHEVGHLFGNYDEHPNGGVNPFDSTYWDVHDSLMGGGVTSTLESRHFNFVLDWVSDASDQSISEIGLSLISAEQLAPPAPVPVPPALWLLGSAVLGLVACKRM